jgi:hypothetical protein
LVEKESHYGTSSGFSRKLHHSADGEETMDVSKFYSHPSTEGMYTALQSPPTGL